MVTVTKPEAKGRKSKTKTVLKLALVLTLVLIVAALVFLPTFVSSAAGRKAILAKVNNLIDGRADFASLSMGWFKGINVADVSFSDGAGQVSVAARQISTKPHYGSLLTGNLSFGETVIDEPKVKIDLKEGRITEPDRPKKPSGRTPQEIPMPIKSMDLVVNNGDLEISGSQGRKIRLAQINSEVNLRPPGEQTSFNLSMAVGDDGKQSTVRANGWIEPKAAKTGWSLKGTSGAITVEVKQFDLDSLGSVFALAGVEVDTKGQISANIKSQVTDGRLDNLTGTVTGKNLDITSPQLKGDKLRTESLDIDMEVTRDGDTMSVDKLQLKSDWADLDANGTLPAKVPGSVADLLKDDSKYNFKGSFNCDVAAVLSQMPKTLGLKEGMKIKSGKLTGSIETFTEAGKARIGGRASLAGLAGVLDEKQIAISEPIRADLSITADDNDVDFDNLSVSAAFAKINASGNAEQIDYKGQVDLAKLQSELGQFVEIGEYKMAGAFSSEGQISIDKSKIAAVGTSALENFRLSSAEGVTASEPMMKLAFAVNMDGENSIVTLDSIEADASLGQVSIKDAVLPTGEEAAKPMDLIVFANQIDLEKLKPFAVLFASLQPDVELSGIAASRISVGEKEGIYQIATDATSIRNLRLVSPGEKPFEQEQVSLTLEAEVDPGQKAINVKTLKLESPQVKIEKRESR